MKRVFLTLSILISFFTFSFSHAESLNLQDALDTMAFIELQISAVTTDMYLGWLPEEKEMMKEASQRAIADLDDIGGPSYKAPFTR